MSNPNGNGNSVGRKDEKAFFFLNLFLLIIPASVSGLERPSAHHVTIRLELALPNPVLSKEEQSYVPKQKLFSG